MAGSLKDVAGVGADLTIGIRELGAGSCPAALIASGSGSIRDQLPLADTITSASNGCCDVSASQILCIHQF
jgi:hypothetical protein